jgi:uncharacterized membrane protein
VATRAPNARVRATEAASVGPAALVDGTPSSGAPASAPPPAITPARWVPWTTTVLSLIALADASYLAFLHFTNKLPLVCSTKGGFVDCEAVLDSKYSHPFGIPIVVPGVIWAVAMVVLCSPRAWRASSIWVSRARLVGVSLGMLTVFYLLWAELIKLHHLCEYCTGVHIVTFALFLVVVFATALAVPSDAEDDDGYASA